MEKEVTNLNDLVNRCIIFTDRNGIVLDKGAHPFSTWLSMEYKSDNPSISFHVQNSPYSNGSSYVKVSYRKRIVLEAEGSFMSLAFDTKAKKYFPGDWEKKIPPYDDLLKGENNCQKMIKIGIIGGSGIDDQLGLENVQKIKKHTPYGSPSDVISIGTLNGREVVAIARHGDKHRIYPTNVNFRANIWALKELGVTHIVAATACGSLREEIKPGHLVFIDQFIDRTTKRHQTFYEGHEVCHIPMAEPFCMKLRELLSIAGEKIKLPFHSKGTMITIEGPRFSTKAESKMFRMWGADVINMTTVPEVVLAREAGICYAAIAMSTDYDCWHESEDSVTLEIILSTMKKNADNVRLLLKEVIPLIMFDTCSCKEAIKTSLL